jgi:hypothetical protein
MPARATRTPKRTGRRRDGVGKAEDRVGTRTSTGPRTSSRRTEPGAARPSRAHAA